MPVAGMLIFGRGSWRAKWQVPLPQRVMNRQLTGVSTRHFKLAHYRWPQR
jgi:hypothetical protein